MTRYTRQQADKAVNEYLTMHPDADEEFIRCLAYEYADRYDTDETNATAYTYIRVGIRTVLYNMRQQRTEVVCQTKPNIDIPQENTKESELHTITDTNEHKCLQPTDTPSNILVY